MDRLKPNMRLRGSVTIFFSAGIWGLFWLPLRHVDQNGMPGLWAITIMLATSLLIALPIAFWRREFSRKNLPFILALGSGMGLSLVFYFSGLILTDVVRVVFLFYLLPIWTTLFSFVIYRIAIGPVRLLAIGFALGGVWLLLGGGGWPVPKNIGDVLALGAGIFWALGLTLVRGRNDLGSFALTASALSLAFIFALIGSFILAAFVPSPQTAIPGFENIRAVIWPALIFGIIILWPTLIGQLWGTKFVASTTAALLTMSEIMVATVSSELLIGSELTSLAWAGGGLIIVAVFIDLWAGDANA